MIRQSALSSTPTGKPDLVEGKELRGKNAPDIQICPLIDQVNSLAGEGLPGKVFATPS